MNESYIFIVMPVGNEEQTIEGTIERIMNLEIEGLLITPVMDSYSKDGTREIIHRMEEKYPRKIKIVNNRIKEGFVPSYICGYKNALKNNAKYIIEMDAGNSHQPEELPRFIEKLNEGYDCVFGSRFMKGGKFINHPFHRIFISWLGTQFSNIFLGTRLKDATSGFEAFNSKVLSMIDLNSFISTGYFFQTEMRYYCKNFRSIEVPITYKGSESRFSSKGFIDAFKEFLAVKKNYKENIEPKLKQTCNNFF